MIRYTIHLQKAGMNRVPLYQQSKKVVSREIEQTIFILDPDTNTVRSLNGTAAFRWKFLLKPTSFDELASRIMNVFDVKRSKCKSHLKKFLDDYIRRGYIKLIA